LAPGSRVGVYEIVAAIGAGGMGEVYRGRDTKLQRDVAIKVLPDVFARDPERLARFEREARTLAALNHPHIAQVYGVVDLPPQGGSHGTAGLVMEFVAGDDLSQRIARAGAIAIDDALPIAIQIAEALEAAHEQQIIHRDLKPANIKVTGEGSVKVLDFGLAKALSPSDLKIAPAGMDHSPTITSPFQMSQLGVILGTAAYMAPEQAKGKPVDKRADIWAFGCVVYEMLTGKRPFAGEDVTDTLAAIVRADPDWSALPGDTPPVVRTLLRRCLEKDRRERLPDIGAARLELRDAQTPGVASVPPARNPRIRRETLARQVALVAAVSAIAAILGFQAARSTETPADERLVKSSIIPPAALSGAPALRMQLSPDGRKLAFVAPGDSGRTVLWVRPLDSNAAQPLAGTTNASAPFWSADGRWLAFIADGKLKKVEASGGAVITLCDAGMTPPGAWNKDDVIVFSGPAGLRRIPASGGTPVPVTTVDAGRGERAHIAPFFLPDSRHFLFTTGTGGMTSRGVSLGSLDGPATTPLFEGSTNVAYANGHLLFLRGSTLMAQPFDLERRALTGQAVPIAEDVQVNPSTGTGAFSVSQNGVLAYQTGPSVGTQLVWFDRAGKRVGTLGESALYRDVRLSRDGRFASATIGSTTSADTAVWLFDLKRNLARRFTFGAGNAFAAVWSPEGHSLVYSARRERMADLFRKSAAGTGPEETLLQDNREKISLGISPDGRTLLYFVPTGAATGKIHVLNLTGDRKSAPVLNTPHSQIPAAISPDGKWLAYVSDETARREVYVTSFPDAAGKWQISTDGGDDPRWSASGKELFFLAVDKLMAVDVSTSAGAFDAGRPKPLFEVRVPAPSLGTRSNYGVSPDGQRFLFNTWDPSATLTPITLVVNWPQSLKK
jgi:serine/threonine protein kinase/Tol biopolymer transport system component